MTRLPLLLALCLLSTGLAAQPPQGGWRLAQNGTVTIDDLKGNDDPRLLITLDEAAAQARRESGGRVLSATTVRMGSKLVHRIKLLTPQKQVRIYEIEAGDAR